MATEKISSIIFSRSVSTDVYNNGSSFSTTLYNPIAIPHSSKGCMVGVSSARVWNSTPNIIEGVNDTLYISSAPAPGAVALVFPQGLYSVEALSNTLADLLEVAGHQRDLFEFLPSSATQQITIRYNYDAVQVNFTASDTFRELLGFDSRFSPSGGVSASAPEYDEGDNIAAFNTINAFLISAPELVNDGIPLNQISNSVVVQVPITSSPNTLINYNPENINWIQSDHLIGGTVNFLTFTLFNENLENIIAVENWSFTVSIKYIM
jgi:hypothetical protein